MIISVNKNLRIESDENNWIVSRYAGKCKGTDRWKPVSFHGTLETAVNALFRRGVRKIESDIPEKIMEAVESLRDDIRSALRRLDDVSLLV